MKESTYQKFVYHLMNHLCYGGVGIKKKRHKYGIKFFESCQCNGIILRVPIYSGQPYNDDIDLGRTWPIVLQLAHDFLDNGCSLFVYNYYNSVALATYLTKRSTCICSTLRSYRKGIPHAVAKAKLKKGKFAWRQSGNVTVCKGKDKRNVLTISNKHIKPEMVPGTNRRRVQKQKSSIVRDYNDEMSRIDHTDQMLSCHSALRKAL